MWLGYIKIQGRSGTWYKFWKHDNNGDLNFPWSGCFVLIKKLNGKSTYAGSGITQNIGKALKEMDLSSIDFICTHTDINRQSPSTAYADIKREVTN